MKLDMPEQVKRALEILESNGFEGFLVGGCIRDCLLAREWMDVDIATDALPWEVMRIFKEYRVIETGVAYGTVTVIIDSMPMEITTYRIDGEYLGNRRPEHVEFTRSLKEDLARRDFTMNAMAYSDYLGIVDYYGGESDMGQKIIRCVGEPDRRFKEDGLRILRGLRFASVLGFSVEKHTLEAMYGNKALLRNISAERTASELVKLLCGQGAARILLDCGDILDVVIPELGNDLTCVAGGMQRVDNRPHLRLAMLLRSVGEKTAEEILRRLKFDNFTVKRVSLLIKYCNIQMPTDKIMVKKWIGKLTAEVFKELIQIKRGIIWADKPTGEAELAGIEKLEALVDEIMGAQACLEIKDLAVRGGNLVSLGVPKGKQIGLLLEYLLELVINEEVENDFTALMEAAAAFNSHGRAGKG